VRVDIAYDIARIVGITQFYPLDGHGLKHCQSRVPLSVNLLVLDAFAGVAPPSILRHDLDEFSVVRWKDVVYSRQERILVGKLVGGQLLQEIAAGIDLRKGLLR